MGNIISPTISSSANILPPVEGWGVTLGAFDQHHQGFQFRTGPGASSRATVKVTAKDHCGLFATTKRLGYLFDNGRQEDIPGIAVDTTSVHIAGQASTIQFYIDHADWQHSIDTIRFCVEVGLYDKDDIRRGMAEAELTYQIDVDTQTIIQRPIEYKAFQACPGDPHGAMCVTSYSSFPSQTAPEKPALKPRIRGLTKGGNREKPVSMPAPTPAPTTSAPPASASTSSETCFEVAQPDLDGHCCFCVDAPDSPVDTTTSALGATKFTPAQDPYASGVCAEPCPRVILPQVGLPSGGDVALLPLTGGLVSSTHRVLQVFLNGKVAKLEAIDTIGHNQQDSLTRSNHTYNFI